MGTKDVFDMELAAREGLEKLGYTQEMTRVRVQILMRVQEISMILPSAVSWFVPHSFQ